MKNVVSCRSSSKSSLRWVLSASVHNKMPAVTGKSLVYGPTGSDLLNCAPPTAVQGLRCCNRGRHLHKSAGGCATVQMPHWACFGKVAIFRHKQSRVTDNKGRETWGEEKQTVSESQQSVSPLCSTAWGTVMQTVFFTLQHLDVLHLGNVWCFHLHTLSTTLKRDRLTQSVLYLHALALKHRKRCKHGRDNNNNMYLP